MQKVITALLVAILAVFVGVPQYKEYKDMQQYVKTDRQEKETNDQQRARCLKAAKDARFYFKYVHLDGDWEGGTYQPILKEVRMSLHQASLACSKVFPELAFARMVAPLQETARIAHQADFFLLPSIESSGGKEHRKGYEGVSEWLDSLPR